MRSPEANIRLYLEEKISIAKNFPVWEVSLLARAVLDSYEHDGSIYTFANGGPAGVAEGFATDLKIHPFVSENKILTTDIRRLKAHCLNESSGVITGVSNDLGYEFIFAEQLKNFLRSPDQNEHDVLIGFSASGNSKNVIKAFEYAKEYGVTTACVSGRDGGKARELCDICIVIPGTSQFPGQTGGNDNNFHIEDFQTSVTHMITGLLKEKVMLNHAR